MPREQLFVTDKLWQTWHSRAAEALDTSLKALGLEYLDLWLLHCMGQKNSSSPQARIGDTQEAYKMQGQCR